MDVDEILKRYAAGERSFQGVNLQEAELTNVNLRGADFSNADLRQTLLGKTNFSQASLREANLSEAILWGIDLSEGDLYCAILREADLTGAKLVQTCLPLAPKRHSTVSLTPPPQLAIAPTASDRTHAVTPKEPPAPPVLTNAPNLRHAEIVKSLYEGRCALIFKMDIR